MEMTNPAGLRTAYVGDSIVVDSIPGCEVFFNSVEDITSDEVAPEHAEIDVRNPVSGEWTFRARGAPGNVASVTIECVNFTALPPTAIEQDDVQLDSTGTHAWAAFLTLDHPAECHLRLETILPDGRRVPIKHAH